MSLDFSKEAEAIRKEKSVAIARGEGIKYGILGLLLGGGILAASRNSNFFIKYMSVSAKTVCVTLSCRNHLFFLLI